MKCNLFVFLVMPLKSTIHQLLARKQHGVWTGTDMLDNILR